jgi:hypothetical protein
MSLYGSSQGAVFISAAAISALSLAACFTDMTTAQPEQQWEPTRFTEADLEDRLGWEPSEMQHPDYADSDWSESVKTTERMLAERVDDEPIVAVDVPKRMFVLIVAYDTPEGASVRIPAPPPEGMELGVTCDIAPGGSVVQVAGEQASDGTGQVLMKYVAPSTYVSPRSLPVGSGESCDEDAIFRMGLHRV